ncbi:MAG TPA: glutamate--tRNA ligase [Acidimicrobiia bacterium]|nr:glutamate--tRNA ligase [Acidimicrobiia bacterium]
MSDSAGVRVRFAPSPTGFLHVGGARTALFNWLYARHVGGTFVLRIEDTDVERSRQDWTEGIQSTLRWLGLDWDEGPYLQSARFDRHLEAAQQLLEGGAAYECFCTEEEVTARYEARKATGPADPGYDGHCRDLSPAERAQRAAEGRPRSIRFRTPDEGVSSFTDVIRGEVTVPWSTIPDFVIVRTSGAPVFYLANAVDDADTGITHVIRGEDLTDTTHRMLALREALGLPGRPTFAHLPLLVGADRAKLSKRHGAISLEDFADRGYLPEALTNYLGLLGFSLPPGDDGASREIVSLAELAAAFDLTRVAPSPAFFDYDKLNWINGEYIRALPSEEFAARCLPFGEFRYGEALDRVVFARAMALAQERATTLADAAEAARFLFVPEDEFRIAPESVERLRGTDRVAEILAAVADHLETCDWNVESVDLRPVLEKLEIKPRKGLPAVYAAIEGTHAGLPLFDSIVLLGRERAVGRARAALRLVADGAS